MDFVYDGGGIGKGGSAAIVVDGRDVAKGRIEKTVPYDVPFRFAGTLGKVTIDLK